MRFSVYLRRFGKLHRLYRFHRAPSGLYMFSASQGSYESWHEDGKWWSRFRGAKTQKRRRQPLQTFKGAESAYNSTVMLLAPTPEDKDDLPINLKADDIVLEIPGVVGTEVILSATPLMLPALPSRPASVIVSRDDIFPVVTIEAWQMPDRMFPMPRFKPPVWVEGENLFFGDTGRIQSAT
jgi:hypothetical protein